jgi:K(+)-stimulated pyrophosphate-energized sodium pump
MLAVSRAAQAMIVEVRRQFREIPGLREGRAGVRPDHLKCIAISTRSSLVEMVLPGAMAIMAPLIIGFGLGQRALVAMLLSAIGSGYMLGILMSNAGGAWDNAKKLVESGYFGKFNSKGSEWHKATVGGDTVGDPFKDTSGPSMNILIKLMTTFGLVTVPLMNRGLDDPDVTDGWIGAILLVVTLVFLGMFGMWNKKRNAVVSALAKAEQDHKASTLGAEEEPLVTVVN